MSLQRNIAAEYDFFNGLLEVLTRHEADAGDLLERALAATYRKDVRADDIVDALVGFVTAAEARGRPLQRLVGQPSHDEKGLPMEMVYMEGYVV